MISKIQRLGQLTLLRVGYLGESGLFIIKTVFRLPRPFRSFPLLIEQLYCVGVFSLPIIIVSGLFIGMVVSLQGYNVLSKFSASEELGQLVALSVVRELGPVVSALLFAGRAGSALTAEIGLMKTTEQLASMEMMGVDPLWRVISPRFWAGILSLPLLSIIFCSVAIIGGYAIGVHWLGVDEGAFWNNMQASVDLRVDVINGVIKSIVFAGVITWIAVYQGFSTKPTAEGIGIATTRCVVYSSLSVLGLDFVLTALMMGGW
jgi:phospholipid/cholesterol/gamma-HCH transport system permease protein